MGHIGVERLQACVGLLHSFQRRIEGADELIELRRQRRQLQPRRQQWRREALRFLRQLDQRLEADPCHPVTQCRGQQHADDRQTDQGDEQVMLGLVKRLSVDADHEPQRWALVLGRELADQHLQRVGLVR
ncbi:hypothetical protein D3C75_1107530 [compost metagenome]